MTVSNWTTFKRIVAYVKPEHCYLVTAVNLAISIGYNYPILAIIFGEYLAVSLCVEFIQPNCICRAVNIIFYLLFFLFSISTTCIKTKHKLC